MVQQSEPPSNWPGAARSHFEPLHGSAESRKGGRDVVLLSHPNTRAAEEQAEVLLEGGHVHAGRLKYCLLPLDSGA